MAANIWSVTMVSRLEQVAIAGQSVWSDQISRAMLDSGELQRRIEVLRTRFRRIRGAQLTWSDPREAALEALLSRGDRRLAGRPNGRLRHAR